MTPRGLVAGMACLLWLLAPSQASAGQFKPLVVQSAKPQKEPRFDVTLAFAFSGGSALGTQQATFTPNQTGTPRYVLFTTDTDLGWGSGVEARVGYHISPAVTIEAGVWLTAANVNVTISGDQEGAPTANFTGERLKHMQFEAHLVLGPPRLRFAKDRVQPYLSIGGGALRQLHAGNTLAENGSVVEAGVGLRIGLGSGKSGGWQRFGLRVDLRACHVQGGFNLGVNSRTYPAGMLGLFLAM